MSAPTILTVTLTGGAGTVVLNIPAVLQSLNSGQTVETQTGFSSADQLVRAIFRAGVFTDNAGSWWPVNQIAKIVAS